MENKSFEKNVEKVFLFIGKFTKSLVYFLCTTIIAFLDHTDHVCDHIVSL